MPSQDVSPDAAEPGVILNLFVWTLGEGVAEINGYVGPPEAGRMELEWDWGDGTPRQTSFFPARHRFADAGTYEIVVSAFRGRTLVAKSRQNVRID